MENKSKSTEKLTYSLQQVLNISIPLYIIDRDFNLIQANETFYSYFQLKKKEVVGKKCFDVIKGPLCNRPGCAMASILQGDSHHEYEMVKKLRTGENITCIVNSLPLRDSSGEITGIVENLTDITLRKHKETQNISLLHHLNERVKELGCMYGLLQSIRTRDSLEEVLQDAADLIAPGLQFENTARGKVVFDNVEYVSESFKETEWKQSSSIVVNGVTRGSIAVFYMEEHSGQDEGPPLSEKQKLINNLSSMISEAVERNLSRNELHIKMEDIERRNKLFTGREYRIVEMKQEVNQLLEELGQAKKYASVSELEEQATH